MTNSQAELQEAAERVHRALEELRKTPTGESVASFTLAGSLVRKVKSDDSITFRVGDDLSTAQIRDRLSRHPLWRAKLRK